MAKPIALFDFCDTLIEGQSVGLFLDYLYRREPRLWKKIRIRINRRFNPHPSSAGLAYKNHLLGPFKGMARDRLEALAESFCHDVLLQRLRHPVVDRLKAHRDAGVACALVSGGLDIYLRPFARHFDMDYVVSTRLKFVADRFSGTIEGRECLGSWKVEVLGEVVPLEDFDLAESFAYGDHPGDIPLLLLVGNGFVVSYGQDIAWMRPYRLGTISLV